MKTNIKPEHLKLVTEIGEKFTFGALKAFAQAVFFVMAVSFLIKLSGCSMDDSDGGRLSPSGMSIHTDALTGRQYLSRGDSLIPRLHADGSPVIVNPEKK